jgi:hypothetical protein
MMTDRKMTKNGLKYNEMSMVHFELSAPLENDLKV